MNYYHMGLSDVESIFSDKNKYKNLKDNVLCLVDRLNNSIIELEKSETEIDKYYKINDGFSTAKKIISNKKNDLIKMRDDIRDVIVPQLERKINELNQQSV